MIKNYLKTFILLSLITLVPQNNLFASELEISACIPYWRADKGVEDARAHIDELDIIHPFVYSVQPDISIKDLGGLDQDNWKALFKEARNKGVKILPTIMWSDGGMMQLVLSHEQLRKLHVLMILNLVEEGNFDGIDIDYEAKRSETKESFSLFLQELKQGLGNKTLSCTIEARTPPDSLYTNVPSVIEYANDLTAIGKYCDNVQIMAYDLGRADVKLNALKKSMPYAPVADIDWVKKVVDLMAKEIPREKIMLAVPTYGYEYIISTIPEQFLDYKRQWSFNPGYAIPIAESLQITPEKNAGGELSFSYFATSSPYRILSALPVPPGTSSADRAAAQALLFSTYTKMTVPFNYMVWSDAGAIKEKINYAKDLGLKGISVFKIDGGEDPKIWDII